MSELPATEASLLAAPTEKYRVTIEKVRTWRDEQGYLRNDGGTELYRQIAEYISVEQVIRAVNNFKNTPS